MKHLLEVIAKALVDQPDKVTVTEKETADAVVLELHVAEGDMGKVIGKQGRIAKAIRTVPRAIFININLQADQVYQISQIKIEFQQENLPENPQSPLIYLHQHYNLKTTVQYFPLYDDQDVKSKGMY